MTERLRFHFSPSWIGEGNGNPLQCSCLENPRDGGAWWAAVYWVAQSRTRLKQLSSSSSMACGILLPRPGTEPTPPALPCRGLNTGPPGRSLSYILNVSIYVHFMKKSQPSSVLLTHWFEYILSHSLHHYWKQPLQFKIQVGQEGKKKNN